MAPNSSINPQEALTVRRNSAQDVQSKVTFMGHAFRGNTVYIAIVAFIAGASLFLLTFERNIVLAGVLFFICPILAAFFIRKFIHNKAKSYFYFWLSQCFSGPHIHKRSKKSFSQNTSSEMAREKGNIL